MEAAYGLLGVVLGAIVVLLSPIITERRKERLRSIRLLNALLTELEYNENATRTMYERNLTLGFLEGVLSTSCYQQARESGILINLPRDVFRNLLDAYNWAARLAVLLNKDISTPREKFIDFIGDCNEVQGKFRVAADGLREYLGASK